RIVADRHGAAGRRRNEQPPEAARSEIRLSALGDDLFEPRLRAVAVENLIGRGDRRLVCGAPGEEITASGLRIERGENGVELRDGGALSNRLSAAVQRESRRRGDPLQDRAGDAAYFRQRVLRLADVGAGNRDGIAVAVERRKLGLEPDAQPRLQAQPGIVLRLLPGAELPRQLV